MDLRGLLADRLVAVVFTVAAAAAAGFSLVTAGTTTIRAVALTAVLAGFAGLFWLRPVEL